MDEIPVYKKFDLTKVDSPYTDCWEFYEEYKNYIGLKLFYLYKNDILNADKIDNPNLRSLVFSKEAFEFSMQEATHSASYSHLTDDEIIHIKAIYDYLQIRKKISLQQQVFLPISHIAELFKLTALEEDCITFLYLCALDKNYEKILIYLQGDINIKSPTLQTILSIITPIGDRLVTYSILFDEHSSLIANQLIETTLQKNILELDHTAMLNKQVFLYLINPASYTPSGPCIKEYYVPAHLMNVKKNPIKLLCNESSYSFILKTIKNLNCIKNKALILHLHGSLGIGKKHIVMAVMETLNHPCIFIDTNTLIQLGEEAYNYIKEIYKSAILAKSYICILNYEVLYENIDDRVLYNINNMLLSNQPAYNKALFILSSKPIKLRVPQEIIYIDVPFTLPDAQKRMVIWKELSSNMSFDEDFIIDEISNKFIFTIGQIEASLNEAYYKASLTGVNRITTENLYTSSYRQLNHNLSEKASLVKPAHTWNDIVLPKAQIQTLKQACNHVVYKNKVFSDWQFSTKISYGQGLSILFSGSPGTGKTMAAQIIANELHMEMYKIQLSQIVSKYIGETEKNLRSIFEEAKNSNVILFFDETDALFGKRSEVKDSHDRYANIETAFLLQQVEEHDGVIILATNLIQNIDEAFMRRIHFIVNFPFPDILARKQIWRSLLPSQAPTDKNIDFDFLAKSFEVSGGHIKNIVMTAAFMAASQNSSISMSHMLLAAIHEQKKLNKIIIKEDLAEYSHLLDEI